MKVASMVTMSPTNILRKSEMQMISTELKPNFICINMQFYLIQPII